MAKKNVARQFGVMYTLNTDAYAIKKHRGWLEYAEKILHYERDSNVPQWGLYKTSDGEGLLLTDDEVKVKRFRYKLYNRYSDAICEVMEYEGGIIGSLWTRLEHKTDFYTPIFKGEHVEVALYNLGMKETLFGFLHIVDDETFDAIIAEFKKED